MSFRWKLIAALALTAFCAVGGTYLLTTSAVSARFDEFRAQQRRLEAQTVAAMFAQYWQVHGTWAGSGILFSAKPYVEVGNTVYLLWPFLKQFMLVDLEHRVVGCARPELVGYRLDETLRATANRYGIPVMVEGKRIGTVVPLDIASLTPLERDFLSSARRAALIGGAVALAVAAVFGVVLAEKLCAPLRRLIQATERIARGDLAHRVAIRARDEIGKLAQAFNRMAETLERSEAARKQLLADVAHELRTPVTVIRGNLEAMLDGAFPLSPESLTPVYEETLHLGELIDDLRLLTLAETGHLPLARELVDLGELVEGACEAVQPAAADSGVEIKVQASHGLWVDADPRRIRQVLGNILANALRYSPVGGTISIKVQRVNAEAWVSVRDQGPGIAADDLPHIFERFYKADKSRSGAGTGLGLAIAKEIVQAHGGRIWAENDGGAVFTFALPLVDRQQP